MNGEMKLKDDRWCFACGSENPRGLALSDIHLEAEECVCSFVPGREHQGWAGIVHGGITSTLLDEVMTHVLWRRGYDAVTAEITVRLREPIPVGERVTVHGRIVRRRGRLAETEGEVRLPGGVLAATATAKFVVSERGPDVPGSRLSLAARTAVIFDLFGTLVPPYHREEYAELLREMGRVLGVDGEAFRQAFRADAALRTTGQWPTLEDNLADIARRMGVSPSPEQLAAAAAMRCEYTRVRLLNPFPDALAALRCLSEAGRPLGLISDCGPETPLLWPTSPLAEYIPRPVFSAAVGLRKPDPAIYQMALEIMGADPYRTVYVGDGDSQELVGAARMGICPILVDRGQESAFRLSQDRSAEIIVHDLTQVPPLTGVG